MSILSHPEMIARDTNNRDAAAHAEDIESRMGAVDALATLAEVAYATRYTGDTYQYFSDVARHVGRMTGWSEDRAAEWYGECYYKASAANAHRR